MLNILLSVTATVLFVLLCVIYPLGILRFSEKAKKECGLFFAENT